MTNPNSEVPFELRHDDALNVPADAGEGTESVLSTVWPRIAERYMAGDLQIHLHLRLSEPKIGDFCTVLERSEVDSVAFPDSEATEIYREGGTQPLFAPRLRHGTGECPHEAQTLMTVYTGQFVEDQKVVVSTLVRLQLMDSCAYLRVHRPDLVHTRPDVVPAGGTPVGLLEGLPIATDREADRPLGGVAGALGGESPGEVVQSAPHVLERVSDDYAEKRRRLLKNLSIKDVLATVRVGLVGNSIRLYSVEGGKLVAENFQMLTCPTQLEAGTIE